MSENRYEFDNPILDVMLEELLGDAAPPDMSTEILAKLNGNQTEMVSQVSITPRHQKKRVSLWAPLSFALSAAACILAVIAISLNSNSPLSPNDEGRDLVAKTNTPEIPAGTDSIAVLAQQNQQPPNKASGAEQPKPMAIISSDDSPSPEFLLFSSACSCRETSRSRACCDRHGHLENR